MNPRVLSVKPMPDMRLELEFLDGRRASFDVSPFVHFPVFEPLQDPAYFCRVGVDHGTVAWPGGIDFDPDTLYLDSLSL